MLRLLDLDLDFFVHGVAHWRGRDHDRLDDDEYPPWSLVETMRFLQERCGLTSKLPGVVVEHHGDLFALWRDAIEAEYLSVPFSVTHVDAHADLGMGDAGYKYLMTDLLFREVADRVHPETSRSGLGDGNFLAFAIACRWIGELVYVFNDGGGVDLLPFHMEGFNPKAANIELKAVRPEEFKGTGGPSRNPDVVHKEPSVPFTRTHWNQFEAGSPFDAICLARSPGFTPSTADPLFEEIRSSFVDEDAWPETIGQ